jgi:hypothetical protein
VVETVNGADLVAALTEWNEFRALDLRQARGVMRGNVLCAICIRKRWPKKRDSAPRLLNRKSNRRVELAAGKSPIRQATHLGG